MTFLDFAARGKTQFWRYLVTWPLGVIFAAVLMIAVLIPPILLHWLPPGFVADLQAPGGHPLTFFLGTVLLSFGAFLLGYIAAIGLLHRKSPADIVGQWSWPAWGKAVVLWLLFLIVATLVDYAIQPQGYRLTVQSLTPTVVAVAIPCIAIQTFTEEFIFRGYLTQSLLLWLKRPWLVSLLSGAAFGAMHIPNGLPSAVAAVGFGVVMSMLAIRTGGLAMGYGIHLVNNLFLSLVVVSEDDVFKGLPAVWTQHTPKLIWSDTGVELVALGVLLWLMMRKPQATPADKYPK